MAKCHRHSCIKDYAVSSLTYIPDLTFVETRRNSYLQTESRLIWFKKVKVTFAFPKYLLFWNILCRLPVPPSVSRVFHWAKFSLDSQNSKSNGNRSVLSTRRRFLVSYRLTRCFLRILSHDEMAMIVAIAFRSSNHSWKRRARNFLNKDGQASFMSDVIPYKRKFRGSLYRIFEANRILLASIYTWDKKLGKLAKMIKVISMQGYACRSNCLSFIMHRVT